MAEFPLACRSHDAHIHTRMARKQTDGTYLVPHLLDFAILRYDRTGGERSRIDTHVAVEPAAKSWPFTAIALVDGGAHAGLTDGNTMTATYRIGEEGARLLEVSPDKRVVWTWRADGPGVHHFHVFEIDGRPVPHPARR